MIRQITVVALTAVLAACGRPSTGEQTAVVGETFQLAYGQRINIPEADFDLTFSLLNEDSRCPERAMCFWEGNASVVVELPESEITLNTSLEPGEAAYRSYLIRLIDVNPYPSLKRKQKPEDYVITLQVINR